MLEFLSSKTSISRSFFLIPRFAGTLVGCWPTEKRTLKTVLIFCVGFFFVTLGAVSENLYGIVYINNLLHALEAFCPGSTKGICSFKMLIFFIYPKDYLNTIVRIKKMLTANLNEDKSKIVRQLASLASKLSFVLIFFGNLTNAFFNLRPIIMGTYLHYTGKSFPLDLPFNAVFPSVLENMPYYPVTFVALTMSGVMTVLTFSAVDGFFVCACMYVTAMFRLLQYDIRQIFEELKLCEYATDAQNLKFRTKLSEIVERHNEITDLCTDFTTQFTVIILLHFLSAAINLCLSMLNFILNFGTISMFIYLSYSIAALTQLFLYCIGGNYVSESSLEVAATLYDIEWYKCDVRTRKMILMMLRRAQKAKTVSVPFFTPSLLAFSSILSSAGSYITLLQTFI